MTLRLLLPLAVLLAAVAAPAAQAAGGGLGIAPSRVDAHVHRGGLVPPITVTNTSTSPNTGDDLLLTALTLVPSCATSLDPDCAARLQDDLSV